MDTPENICKFVMNPGTETDIKMMDRMLQKRLISSPNVRCGDSRYGTTALMHQSSSDGTPEAMKFLIDKGADLNLINQMNDTALFFAVRCTKETGLREKTLLLLRAGAKVFGLKENKYGETLIEACDNQEMKAILQERANQEDILQQQSKRRQQERVMYEESERIKRDKMAAAEEKQKQILAEAEKKQKQILAEAEEKQKQILAAAEAKQKQILAEAEAKEPSDPDEKKYQKIEMTSFYKKGGKTKKRRRKRRKTRKHRKPKNNRKSRK
jgi:ankyrin repeat protein